MRKNLFCTFLNWMSLSLLLFRIFLLFSVGKIESGMKYLGFHLKCCRYLLKDWDWMISKVEKRIRNWSFRWLSKGGKLILSKAVLEEIPVFWMYFWIPVGILEKIRKICFIISQNKINLFLIV